MTGSPIAAASMHLAALAAAHAGCDGIACPRYGARTLLTSPSPEVLHVHLFHRTARPLSAELRQPSNRRTHPGAPNDQRTHVTTTEES